MKKRGVRPCQISWVMQLLLQYKVDLLAAAWTLSFGTMASATLDVALQTRTPSMVCSTMNFDIGIVWYSVFWQSRICLQHHDVRICAWRHHGKATLPPCIRHHNIGSSPKVMVWDAIGYTSSSPVIHIDGPLNRGFYLSAMLRPIASLLIRSLRNV